ncbi:hypothetical protein D3C71_1488350 [compost metagenome]
MTDVITAPERYIVTDPAKWLKSIVFENQTIIADLLGQNSRTRADVARHGVAQCAHRIHLLCAQHIHAIVGQGHEGLVLGWRKLRGHIFKCNERFAKDRIGFHKLSVDREGRYSSIDRLTKKIVNDLGNITGAENNNGLHRQFVLTAVVESLLPHR